MIAKKEIAVFGASGFGREVAWLIESVIQNGKNCQVVCFIDDKKEKQGQQLNGIPVMSLESVKTAYPKAVVVMGIGNPRIRELLIGRAESAGFGCETVIHPRVELSKLVKIGEGTVICAGSILTTNITLGKHVQINLDCTIGHDVVMGDYSTLAPGVHVSGWVHFGKRVYVGTGAVFINGTETEPLIIGDDAVVGAGACVTQSIPSGETWGGVPARRLKD